MNDQERIAAVLLAVRRGRITLNEGDYYLRATSRTTYAAVMGQPVTIEPPTRFSRPARIALFLALLGIAALTTLFLHSHATTTGLIILAVPAQPVTNTTLSLNQTVTSITITGTITGDGNATILFDTDHGTLLLATITSDNGSPLTDRASYQPGEPVTLLHAPPNATDYFDDGNTLIPVDVPFNASTNGTLLIVANDTGNLTAYRVPIIIGNVPRTTTFTNACTQTCTMNATNGTLRITTTGNATLHLTSIDATADAPNSPPLLTLKFDALTINRTTVLNLTDHFTDADGDTLYYTTGTSNVVTATTNGSPHHERQ